ncbi:MAG: cupin [Frankiales bacterium]|nr:cupin [Frankiales bacterium]
MGRLTLQPGWRWSSDAKPIAGTEWCEAPRMQVHLSGRVAIHMAYGNEFVAAPSDVTSLAGGHDAWVVGEEAVVA